MKKIHLIYILSIGLLLFSCKSEKNKHIKFEISGNLESYEQQKIVLQSDEVNEPKNLFVATKKNGYFYIRSKKNLPINQYYLKIGDAEKRIPILIDNTDLKVYLDNLDLDNSYTKGASEYQKAYSNYKSTSKIAKNIFAYQKMFIENNNNTELGAIVLKDILGKTQWRLEQSKVLYDQLAPFIQKSNLGEEIDTYITAGLENLKKEALKTKVTAKEIIITKPQLNKKPINTSNLSKEISDYAPYFYADDLNGSELSVKTVFNKNKLTLIDFWASWCAPCRVQNPDLIRFYNKYHSKGFEILSVSEDKDSNNWRDAIALDQMGWLHVKDDYKRIANMYKVKTIPHALLVNKQGGIIVNKVSMKQLEKLLQSEFGF